MHLYLHLGFKVKKKCLETHFENFKIPLGSYCRIIEPAAVNYREELRQ